MLFITSFVDFDTNCKRLESLSGNEAIGDYHFHYLSQRCAKDEESSDRRYLIQNDIQVKLPVNWKNNHETFIYCTIPGNSFLEIRKPSNHYPIKGKTSIHFGFNKDEFHAYPLAFIENPEASLIFDYRDLIEEPKVLYSAIEGSFLSQNDKKFNVNFELHSFSQVKDGDILTIGNAFLVKDENSYKILQPLQKPLEGLSLRLSILEDYPVEKVKIYQFGETPTINYRSHTPNSGYVVFEDARYFKRIDNNIELFYNQELLFTTTIPIYIPTIQY